MSHINTAWQIPLCQMPGGLSLKHVITLDVNNVQCSQCKNRHFAMLNKQDFYISADKSLYLFPLVRNTTPAEGNINPTKPDFVIIDDHDQNIGIDAAEYDIFLQRYLDWRVNK